MDNESRNFGSGREGKIVTKWKPATHIQCLYFSSQHTHTSTFFECHLLNISSLTKP